LPLPLFAAARAGAIAGACLDAVTNVATGPAVASLLALRPFLWAAASASSDGGLPFPAAAAGAAAADASASASASAGARLPRAAAATAGVDQEAADTHLGVALGGGVVRITPG